MFRNDRRRVRGFSALQRAEIAEISRVAAPPTRLGAVSVLFNEPKLLKLNADYAAMEQRIGFSALQRAEIAETHPAPRPQPANA